MGPEEWAGPPVDLTAPPPATAAQACTTTATAAPAFTTTATAVPAYTTTAAAPLQKAGRSPASTPPSWVWRYHRKYIVFMQSFSVFLILDFLKEIWQCWGFGADL